VRDLLAARGIVLLQTPYITLRALKMIEHGIKNCIARGVPVCVFAQRPPDWHLRDDAGHSPVRRADMRQLQASIQLLEGWGVHCNLRDLIHENLIVIDEDVFWEGSLNYLSHFDTSERLNRWVSRDKVAEARREHQLDTCDHCRRFDKLSVPEQLRLLGQQIATRRKLLGLTQAALAQRAATKQCLVSQLELGRRQVLAGTLARVCRALGMTLMQVPTFMVEFTDRHTRQFFQTRAERDAENARTLGNSSNIDINSHELLVPARETTRPFEIPPPRDTLV
jgi:transcriptional regulator with XRE-family HTH domain